MGDRLDYESRCKSRNRVKNCFSKLKQLRLSSERRFGTLSKSFNYAYQTSHQFPTFIAFDFTDC